MREEFNLLIKFCATRTVPAAETKSIGLQADAQVVMVFALHQDNFIMTRQILPTYRDHAIWTASSWHQTLVHLSGLCKNACQPWHGRQLIKPPGRYSAFEARDWPQICHDERTITPIHFINKILYLVTYPASISGYRDNCIMVFATTPRQFYHDVTTSYRLTGFSRLDNFIVTRKSCPLTKTLQKQQNLLI